MKGRSGAILSLLIFCVTAWSPIDAGVRFGVGFGAGGHRRVVSPYVRIAGPAFRPSFGFHYHQRVRYRGSRFGKVDFNVFPKDSEIYVDGGYIGIADQFDGSPLDSKAKLPAGTHRIRIVAPNGQVLERKIYVMPGKEVDIDVRF